MSDSLNAAAQELQAKIDEAGFDGSVKFEMEGTGVIRIVDGAVSTEDGDAECVITGSVDTFQELFAGDLDPTAAFMTGKIKIDGDMSQAMKLSQLLG